MAFSNADRQFPPIGSGNALNPDLRVSLDRAHGPYPVHIDMVVPIPEFKIAHKIRVDEHGKLITDELSY